MSEAIKKRKQLPLGWFERVKLRDVNFHGQCYARDFSIMGCL